MLALLFETKRVCYTFNRRLQESLYVEFDVSGDSGI